MYKKLTLITIVLILCLTGIFAFFNKEKTYKETKQLTYTNETNSTEETENQNWYTDWEYEIVDNYISLVKYNGNETNYTIPAKATIDNNEYTTKLIEEGIFTNTPVTDLKISDGVIIENNGNLFTESSIENLDCSNMDLSNRTDMTFLNGWYYKNVNFSNANLSNVEYFRTQYIFLDSEIIDFSNANLKSLKELGNTFFVVKADTLTFENVIFESITKLSGLIDARGTIDKVIFKNTQFPNYTGNVGFLVSGPKINYIDFSGASFPKANGLSNMFYGCQTVKKIDISNLSAPVATTIYDMFQADYFLEEVIMDGFSAPNVTESTWMFNACRNLKKVTVDGVQVATDLVTPYMEELIIKNANIIETDFTHSCKLNVSEEEQCKLKKITFENVNTIKTKSVINLPQLEEITILGDTEIEPLAFYFEPVEFQSSWGHLSSNYSYLGFNSPYYMPVRRLTKVNTDNFEVLKYNWERDNRFISDNKTHTVVYKYLDGITEDESQSFTAGEKIKEEVPKRDTYEFQGWNTKEDGSGKLYNPTEIIYINDDLTLYAQWKRTIYDDDNKVSGWLGEQVKWRLDSDTNTVYVYPEGEDSDGRLYDFMDLDDSPISIPNAVCRSDNIVFEDGITYIGRNLLKQCRKIKVVLPESLEEIGSGAFFMNIDELEGFNPSIKTHNASFAYVNIDYSVTIDANGGKFSDDSTQQVKTFRVGYIEYYYNYRIGYYNRTVNGFDVETPIKEGYTFVGFNTKEDGTGDYVGCIDNQCVLRLPHDTTIYAIYEKDKIRIDYNVGDGSFAIESEELFYNEPITTEKPTKDGFVFAEWNTKEDGSGEVAFAGQDNHFKEDTTLYAIYRKELLLDYEARLYYANSANRVFLEDGSEIRVIPFNSEYGTSSRMVYEVSKEYLKEYGSFKYIEIDEEIYNELIAMVATFSEYNEGGLFDTFNCPENFYDKMYGMPGQFSKRIIDPFTHTSNGGYERYMHVLRFRFIYEHSKEMGEKYKLRVFTDGNLIWIGIEPKKSEVTIKKVDSETGEQLKGATLLLYNEEGRFVDFFTTTEEQTTLNLPVGNTYRLVENNAPEGYKLADDIIFTINSDEFTKNIEMKDDSTEEKTSSSLINPETADRILIVLILSVVSLGLAIYFKKKKETY